MEELDGCFGYVHNAQQIISGEKKGNNEDVRRYLTKAVDAAEDALIEFDADDEPNEKFLARFMCAWAMATKAKYDPNEAGKLLTKAAVKVAKCVKHHPKDEDCLVLQARILVEQADLQTTSLQEREKLYVDASDIMLQYAQTEGNLVHKPCVELMKKCKDYFLDGEKHRERNGFAVYRSTGEFWKEGGEVKSWKNRFFVMDDSYLAYYKSQKEWENGPVKGASARPKGLIELWEVRDASIHNTSTCPTVPKKPHPVENSYCLHISTPTRLYNMVGFDTKEDAEKWLNSVNFAVKFQRILKTLKVVSKEKAEAKGASDPYNEVDTKHKTFEPLYKEFVKKEKEAEKKMKEKKEKKKKERDAARAARVKSTKIQPVNDDEDDDENNNNNNNNNHTENNN